MGEQAYEGQIASPGLALGRWYLLRSVGETPVDPVVGTPKDERGRLIEAMADAKSQLVQLMSDVDLIGADILAFQEALLEDEDFVLPALDAIANGRSAIDAWNELFDAEINSYQASDDGYMAARGEDYEDLKQRVANLINGVTSGPPVKSFSHEVIAVAAHISPSEVLSLDRNSVVGIVVCGGSTTGHAAILARARGIPMLVGCSTSLMEVSEDETALIDAEVGSIVVNPGPSTYEYFVSRVLQKAKVDHLVDKQSSESAITMDGERVGVLINVDDPSLILHSCVEICDGIGLTRTEWLFQEGLSLSEEAQYEVYKALLIWADGRPVTIRTLDAGGDKPITGMSGVADSSSFLGVRGYRFSQQHPEIFDVQLRALARAAVHGSLKVMIPMVTVPSEMRSFRQRFNVIIDELKNTNVAHARPQLGMMVEVPAAALMISEFEAEFFSIGTNDLIQFTLAASRECAELNDLVSAGHAAVFPLIKQVVDASKRKGIPVSVCGDMATHVSTIPALLDLGLRELSVSWGQVGQVKECIRQYCVNKERT